MISNLVEPLRPYWSLVLAAYFVGFFLATLVAIAYNENRVVRRAYVGGFMSLLIATNLFLPSVAPLTEWHKFSRVPPDERVMYEVRVVDARGDEIRYDASATWAVDGISMRHAREEMLAADPERRRELARYLLEEAREHRTHLRNRSPVYLLRFPPHGTANTYVASELEAYGRFVGVRIYRMEIRTSPDGTEITDYSEEVVYEYLQNETTNATGDLAGEPVANSRSVEQRTGHALAGKVVST